MKKIFALVLAVAMLSSNAFALILDSNGAPLPAGASVKPDSTIYMTDIEFAYGTSRLSVAAGEFVNAGFYVSKKSFMKGAELVESVTIDDGKEAVAIKLKQDLELTAPTDTDNLVIGDITVKAKKDIKYTPDNTSDRPPNVDGAKKGQVYNYSPSPSPYAFKVGYTATTVTLDDPKYVSGGVAEFTKGNNGETYGNATLVVGDFYMEGRVHVGDKIFTNVSFAPDTAVLKNPDYADANLRFIQVTTAGLFAGNTVQLTAAEGEFVYEIVNKQVVSASLKWDAGISAFTGRVNGGKSYVLSDIELVVDKAPVAGSATATNPETGANDVVGVSAALAALAVLSLVAAGAVSLKK